MKQKRRFAKPVLKRASITLSYYCERASPDEEITIDLEPHSLDAYVDNCHGDGEINVSFKCRCGKDHTFQIYSW